MSKNLENPTEELEKSKVEKVVTWEEFFNNPDNEKKARLMVKELIEDYRLKNWFSLSRYMKKIKVNSLDAERQLMIYNKFGLCRIKTQYGKGVLYKLSLDYDSQIMFLEDEMIYNKERMQQIKKEIKVLQEKKKRFKTK